MQMPAALWTLDYTDDTLLAICVRAAQLDSQGNY
jgi:hypothetical protein